MGSRGAGTGQNRVASMSRCGCSGVWSRVGIHTQLADPNTNLDAGKEVHNGRLACAGARGSLVTFMPAGHRFR